MKRNAKQMTAASWDQVWTAYTAAVRSGDGERLSAAKADVRMWHGQAGVKAPSWAE